MTPSPTPTPRMEFQPRWPLLLLAMAFLPLLLGLGFWQLDRAAQKRAMEADYRDRQAAAPVVLGAAAPDTVPVYTRVMATGRFDNQHRWYVDNRQRGGRTGFEVVQPFALTGGARVLVNRGWVAAPPDRRSLPEVPAVEGEVTVFAQMDKAGSHPMLSASAGPGWPKVITQVEPAVMAEALGEPLAGRYLKLDAASPGALRTGWQAVNMHSSRHTGYAFQWFAMALALVILTVFANTNLAALWRARRQSNASKRGTHNE